MLLLLIQIYSLTDSLLEPDWPTHWMAHWFTASLLESLIPQVAQRLNRSPINWITRSRTSLSYWLTIFPSNNSLHTCSLSDSVTLSDTLMTHWLIDSLKSLPLTDSKLLSNNSLLSRLAAHSTVNSHCLTGWLTRLVTHWICLLNHLLTQWIAHRTTRSVTFIMSLTDPWITPWLKSVPYWLTPSLISSPSLSPWLPPPDQCNSDGGNNWKPETVLSAR